MRKFCLAVVVSGVWMNLSEFVRNEFVIKHVWVKGFEEIGLSFPSAPINGVVWVIWTFIFCAVLTVLNMKFNALKSTVICWVTGFGLLWIAMWNIGILPKGLLYWAVPWSFVEVYVAAFICNRIVGGNNSWGSIRVSRLALPG
jgi:hypothetical protein